jgi:phosphotransferase system  glucose/maltose/N-acetylglucosamine-specific IIC component
MDWVVVVGVISLGVLVGLLVGWYVNEDKAFTTTALAASVSTLSGAGVLGVFHLIVPATPTREYWFYPVGMLVGVLIAPFLDMFFNGLYENKPKRRKV